MSRPDLRLVKTEPSRRQELSTLDQQRARLLARLTLAEPALVHAVATFLDALDTAEAS